MARSPFTDRVLALADSCLTEEVAQRLVELRLPPDLQSRLEELASRDQAGGLTPHEKDEYSDYIDAIDTLGLVQALARSFLRRGRG